MPVIASGTNKQVVIKRQAALGTIAPPTGPFGQLLRRTQSTLDKKKASYSSKEIRPSQQRSDMRHGVVSVDGTISGELSVGTYQAFTESILRQNVQPAVTLVTAINDVVTASTGASTGSITLTAGNFLTGNLFKIGKVIRATGFTTTATNNNAKNLLITSITSNGKVMTVSTLDGSAIVAKSESAAVTFTEVGKSCSIPVGSQTRDYYTIEHWFSDVVLSERFVDCVISQMDVKLPASGMATVDFNVMGLDMVTGGAQYFTTPLPATNGSNLAAVNGLIFLAGAPVGLITGMNFSVKGGYTTIGGVVGSNKEPDIFPGSIDVDGQLTVLFTDAVTRDYFLNETEVSLFCVFTTSNAANSDFIGYTMPRVKLGGASKDDGDGKGLVMTMPFTALENLAGGNGTATAATTITIQDSAFV